MTTTESNTHTMSRAQASALCSFLRPAVSKNSTLPVLGYIHITADERGIHYSSSDLDLNATVTDRDHCWSQYSFSIPFLTLEKCINSAPPNTPISISPKAITFGKTTVPIHHLGLDEMQFHGTLHSFANLTRHPINTPGLAGAFTRTLPVVSKDEACYVLNGVCYDSTGVIVATDGKRLHAIPDFPAIPASAIIPTKAIPAGFTKADSIAFYFNEESIARLATAIRVSANYTFTLTTRLVEGNFPNWQVVVPEDFLFSLRFDSTSARDAAKTYSRLSNNEETSIRLRFGKNCFTLSGPPDSNLPTTVHPAIIKGPVPENFIAYFNPSFLADAMHPFLDTLQIKDATSSFVFRKGTEKHILMPKRT